MFEKMFDRFLNKKESFENGILPYLISPSSIIDNGWNIKAGINLNRIFSIIGIPRVVRAGFLNPLLLSDGTFDLSLHIFPKSTDHTVSQLNTELIKLTADLHTMEAKGEIIPPSLKIKYEDTLRVLAAIQSGEEQLFDLSFYLNCKGEDEEKLRESTSKACSTLGQLSLLHKDLDFQLHKVLPSVMPLANDEVKFRRSMTSSALAACFPFTSSNLQISNDGIVFGINNSNGIPIILDLFELQNPNMLILGSSGSGKSFAAKTILSRLKRAGTKVMIIDPQAEYVKLTSMFSNDGQIIGFGPNDKYSVNALDCRGLTLSEKIQSLMGLFSLMFGNELTAAQKSFLDEALYEIYEARGISDITPQIKQIPPTFSDLYEYSKKKSTDMKDNSTSRATALAITNRLRPFTKGSLKCFDRQTNIDLKSSMVVFDISYFVDKMQTVAPPAMYILLDFLHQQIKTNPSERKAIAIDEAWRLLSSAESNQYLLLFAKTARKYNTSFQIISQELSDLSKSQAGMSILANTSVKMIFRQDPSVIETLSECLKLTTLDKNKLLNSKSGHGLLIVENVKLPYYCLYAPYELNCLSTTTSQINKMEEFKKEIDDKKVNRILNFELGCYKKHELSEEQLIVLLKNGFIVTSAYDIISKRPLNFVVKRRYPESLQHSILVSQIEELIRQYTQEVKINITVDADIVFTNKNGEKIALEIETGLNNHLNAKIMAVRARNYSKTVFVLTETKLQSIYRPLGQVLFRSKIEDFIKENLQ